MKTIAAPIHTASDSESAPGSLVRHFAVTAGLTYASLVFVMMVTTPNVARSPVLWTLLVIVGGGAGLTYLAGRAIERRTAEVDAG